MNQPINVPLCSQCGLLIPFPETLGAPSNLYCDEPEHWSEDGLDVDHITAGLAHRRAKWARLEASAARLRKVLAEPEQPSPSTPRARAIIERMRADLTTAEQEATDVQQADRILQQLPEWLDLLGQLDTRAGKD